jgi:hypothetical protein
MCSQYLNVAKRLSKNATLISVLDSPITIFEVSPLINYNGIKSDALVYSTALFNTLMH